MSSVSYIINKNFCFESAHRLIKGYQGICSNIHGHSWTGHISLGTDSCNQFDMSIDFNEIQPFITHIEALFDHKLLLCRDDQSIINCCDENQSEVFIFEDNPTCEVIAKYIYDSAVEWFQNKVTVISVTVNETCTASLTYSG